MKQILVYKISTLLVDFDIEGNHALYFLEQEMRAKCTFLYLAVGQA